MFDLVGCSTMRRARAGAVSLSTMKVLSLFGLLMALVLLASCSARSENRSATVSATKRPAAPSAQALGSLPLLFEKNAGQADKAVQYLARGSDYALLLTGEEAVLKLQASDHSRSTELSQAASGHFANVAANRPIEVADSPVFLRLSLPGSRKGAQPRAESPQAAKSNYFIGNDPAKWLKDLPSYSQIRYADVFPGIDIVYYGNRGRLEYDFIVAPGADPKPIRLAFRGARNATLDKFGNLDLDVNDHHVVQHKPVVYQEIDGRRAEVSGSYVLNPHETDTPIEVSLTLGNYDRSRPLIIDPVLVYSTYVSGSDLDIVTSIALDSEGNLYATGYTFSVDFPIVGALPPEQGGQNNAGSMDAFVLKLNPTGNALIYSTYLSGSDADQPFAVKVNVAHEAYIAGYTASTDFPIVGGLPPEQAGTPSGAHSPFVTKLNATGDALVYSTYIAADDSSDEVYALGLDSAGSAYITGLTTPPYHFPVVGGLPGNLGGHPAGDGAIFIAKLDPAGDSLTYSTYLSGSGFEWGSTLAVDSLGQVYVGGLTSSANLPRVGGLPDDEGGAPPAPFSDNAYYAKLNSAGNDLIYSTYFGGSATDYGDVLTIDTEGNLYIAGRTSSSDLPIVGGLSSEQGGGGRGDNCCADIFLAKLNPAGNALIYSTYLAGNYIDGAYGLVVDDVGNLYVAGQTNSTNFPQVSGLPSDQGGNPPIDNGNGPPGPAPCSFVSKLNPAGDSLIFSTYLCGNNPATSLARSDSGEIYVAGSVGDVPGIAFPVVGGLPPNQGGTPLGPIDGFITKLTEDAPLLSFERARFSVLRTDTTVEVAIVRSGPADGAVNVDFATSDGTATAGTDYVAATGTLSWPADDIQPKTISIDILSNSVAQGDVFFKLQLSNAALAEIGTPDVAAVTIRKGELIFADGFDTPLQSHPSGRK